MRELTLLKVDSEAIGYGRLGVKLAAALADIGVDVYDDIAAPWNAQNHLTEQVEGARHKKTNVAAWISTPGHARGWWEGQHAGIFTMWEATRLPEAYREHLHHFQTVVVPSDHNLELFSLYHPNVRVAYLGVDPAEWFFIPRLDPGVTFNFLIGGSGARKGTDLAYQAFRKAFPEGSWGDGPVPQLIFKNPKGEDFYGDRVQMITGRMPAEDEQALYSVAHCYLQPSRGEGFGLQPLQAMAQGIPTILTNAHGHASFAHLGYGIGSKLVPASYFIYGDAGEWWEPDLDELIDRMRWVYDNYDEAREFAAESARVVARDFTWRRCAEQFVDAFDGALDVPYEGSGEWFTPEYKLYKVILNRDWTADIAGTLYRFQRGVTYYEHSDVKRILFEAGLLDPACLEAMQIGENSGQLDTGLTEKEVERIGAYSARHSFCDHCGQQVGTQPTKADLLFTQAEKMRVQMAEFGLSDVQIDRVMNG